MLAAALSFGTTEMPITRRQVGFVSDLIALIDRNLRTTVTIPTSGLPTFFSDEKHTVLLSTEDAKVYHAALTQLVSIAGKQDNLSRRGAELFLQKTLLLALDPAARESQSLEERTNSAISGLLVSLNSPVREYRCYLPIKNLSPDDLPFHLGAARFAVFDQAEYSTPYEGANKKFLGTVGIHMGVHSMDADAAKMKFRRICQQAVDTMNFFSDLVPYNHGWLCQPEDPVGASVDIVLDDGPTWLRDSERIAPYTPFSFGAVYKEKWLARSLRRVQHLYASPHNEVTEIILSCLQWAGRATVARRREESFLLYAIALETMILPIQDTELNYRLATRVARLIGASQHRRKVRERITGLYRVRSKIVHSGSYEVTDSDLGAIRKVAKACALAVLSKKSIGVLSKAKELDAWFEERAG